MDGRKDVRVQSPTWGKTVQINHNGHVHLVRSAREALEVLFSDWPKSEGRAYFSALEACAKTEWGEATHYDARYAFILAIVEAGLYFEVQ
jgi:hypothetical protein